jgi:UDP-N-acetylmuramate dehydrogenase
MKVEIMRDEPLARYVSWRIGGPARFFGQARSADDMRALLRWGREQGVPVFVLGGGTNILIGDRGYPGLVIRNRAANSEVVERGDDVTLHAEAGAPMAGTARRWTNRGFGGLQWAEGLPGTVGGAVYGNAGCYGSDTATTLLDAEVVLPDGTTETWDAEQLGYGYRTSRLKQTASEVPNPHEHAGVIHPVVLAARFRLERGDPEQLGAEMAAIAAGRRSKTPSGSSCGSSFKNPPGTTAGRLLDLAGLKGTREGGAVVSDVHANYIVNAGGATATDVLRLTEIMRERVLREFGVELELEIQRIGEF